MLLLQTRLRIARVRPVTSVTRRTRNVDTPPVVCGETPFERLERLERDQHAQRVLQILTQNDIPIGLIAELAADDALFAADPERVAETLSVLSEVWPSAKRLHETIRRFPFVLYDESWLERLPRATADLVNVGFSGVEAAKMIVSSPDVVYVRIFEVNNAIKAIERTVDSEVDKAIVLKFLARNPVCLRDGARAFRLKVDAVAETLLLRPEDVAAGLLRQGQIFDADVGTMKASMEVLSEFLGRDIARAVVAKEPALLSMTAKRVQESVRVLRVLEVKPEDVASYPAALVRSPYTVVGPRVGWLRMLQREDKRHVRLATYLSLSERKFEERYVKGSRDAWEQIMQEWKRRRRAAAAVPIGAPATDGGDAEKAGKREPPGTTTQSAHSAQSRKPSAPLFRKRLAGKRLPRLKSSGREEP